MHFRSCVWAKQEEEKKLVVESGMFNFSHITYVFLPQSKRFAPINPNTQIINELLVKHPQI